MFENGRELWRHETVHTDAELRKFHTIGDETLYRFECIQNVLSSHGPQMNQADAIVGIGGAVAPVQGGTYRVTPLLLADLESGIGGMHPYNMGAILAQKVAATWGGRSAFMSEPMVVDELAMWGRVSGIPEIERKSMFHALSQRGAAHHVASVLGKRYENMNMVVAHVGVGISVGAHSGGMVIEVNNVMDGEGPFTSERSGVLPVGELLREAYSGKYELNDIKEIITKKGGLIAHLGTSDTAEIDSRIDGGDKKAGLVVSAMAYCIAKDIAARSVVLRGRVDATVITGPLASWQRLVSQIEEWIDWIAPVHVIEHEQDLAYMAEAAVRILNGDELPLIYEDEKIKPAKTAQTGEQAIRT